MTRVCIIAECVPLADVALVPGVVTSCVDRLSDGLAAIRARECDVVITPETLGSASAWRPGCCRACSMRKGRIDG